MTREFSFKVYNPNTGRVWGPFSMDDLPKIKDGEEDAHRAVELAFDWKQLIWLPTTHLQDRNKKEIFVGDLLVLDLISGDRFSEVKICDTREIPVVRFFEGEDPFDGWEPLHAYVGKHDTCLQICAETKSEIHERMAGAEAA